MVQRTVDTQADCSDPANYFINDIHFPGEFDVWESDMLIPVFKFRFMRK